MEDVELELDGGDGEELEFDGGGADSGEEAIGEEEETSKIQTLYLLSLNHSNCLRTTNNKQQNVDTQIIYQMVLFDHDFLCYYICQITNN